MGGWGSLDVGISGRVNEKVGGEIHGALFDDNVVNYKDSCLYKKGIICHPHRGIEDSLTLCGTHSHTRLSRLS